MSSAAAGTKADDDGEGPAEPGLIENAGHDPSVSTRQTGCTPDLVSISPAGLKLSTSRIWSYTRPVKKMPDRPATLCT